MSAICDFIIIIIIIFIIIIINTLYKSLDLVARK